MLPPIQNQELVQRSDTMSEMRSHEQGKAFADIAKSASEVHRLERLKETTVQQNQDTEALDPDGGGGKGQDRQQQEQQQQENSQPQTSTPARPLHIEGGDIVDLTA